MLNNMLVYAVRSQPPTQPSTLALCDCLLSIFVATVVSEGCFLHMQLLCIIESF